MESEYEKIYKKYVSTFYVKVLQVKSFQNNIIEYTLLYLDFEYHINEVQYALVCVWYEFSKLSF